MTLTEEQLNRLAMQASPFDTLAGLQKMPRMPMGLDPNMMPPGPIDPQARAEMLPLLQPTQPGQPDPTKVAPQGAPLDPRSLAMLNSMMPQDAQPRFIGGAAPRPTGQINLGMGAGGGAPGQVYDPKRPQTLAQLLGMR